MVVREKSVNCQISIGCVPYRLQSSLLSKSTLVRNVTLCPTKHSERVCQCLRWLRICAGCRSLPSRLLSGAIRSKNRDDLSREEENNL